MTLYMYDLVYQRKICHMQASPLERAELYVTVAQATQTLFCMYLRLHGISPEDHPIAREDVRTTPKSVYALQASTHI